MIKSKLTLREWYTFRETPFCMHYHFVFTTQINNAINTFFWICAFTKPWYFIRRSRDAGQLQAMRVNHARLGSAVYDREAR